MTDASLTQRETTRPLNDPNRPSAADVLSISVQAGASMQEPCCDG